MKPSRKLRNLGRVFMLGALVVSLPGLAALQAKELVRPYPIDATVVTTQMRTVIPDPKPARSIELSDVRDYKPAGYGTWHFGDPLDVSKRTELMPADYRPATPSRSVELLHFFTISDIHITDKESPSQLIYLQQLVYPELGKAPWSFVTSIYSPVMLYTTQVLDAAVQTVNALHKQHRIDFGLSLGDTCNSTQYNETRWYIDVLDGQAIYPSSGKHAGQHNIDYQRPYQAVGLDKRIPWYQALGNHDHFWIGSIPVDELLRKSYVSDKIFATGDVLANPANITKPDYYMGVLDGATPYGTIRGAGPVAEFKTAPRVVADPQRRSLALSSWMQEFFKTTTLPRGHGFNPGDAARGFACYSFVPKARLPIKVIVLDDTQNADDGSPDIHGHGYLDQARWTWLKRQLDDGQAAGQLMIIAAHIPIGVEKPGSELGWWDDPLNAVSEPDLINELAGHPNFVLWLAGHRHLNTVKAFAGASPENSFWQVETSSLRDFPQQLRTFSLKLNSDNTLSIVTTNVDPAVRRATPAATARGYAVAAQQIVNTNVYTNNPTNDPSIKPMPTGSYNAELFKQLSPAMQIKLRKIVQTK